MIAMKLLKRLLQNILKIAWTKIEEKNSSKSKSHNRKCTILGLDLRFGP